MEGMNKVFLLGNLGADPELRMTSGGQAVLNIRLATTENYVDGSKQRKERTEWHNVIVWGNRAEALSRILAKGSRILVEGRIQSSSYEGKDGQKRFKTDIVSTNILLQGGGPERQDQAERRGKPAKDTGDDFPEEGEDDLPF